MVAKALQSHVPDDDFAAMQMLQQVSGVPIPPNLARLQQLRPQEKIVVAPTDMGQAIIGAAKEVFNDDQRVRSGNER